MSVISVKLCGRYYNVECDEGMTAKQARERAVRLKRLGKPFSGPVQAKRGLPKEKVKEEVKEKPVVNVEKKIKKKKKK